MIEKH